MANNLYGSWVVLITLKRNPIKSMMQPLTVWLPEIRLALDIYYLSDSLGRWSFNRSIGMCGVERGLQPGGIVPRMPTPIAAIRNTAM